MPLGADVSQNVTTNKVQCARQKLGVIPQALNDQGRLYSEECCFASGYYPENLSQLGMRGASIGFRLMAFNQCVLWNILAGGLLSCESIQGKRLLV